MGSISTTVSPLLGGVTAVAGVSSRWRAEIDGTYAVDDLLRFVLTNAATAETLIAGYGTVTGLDPSFLFTFSDKVNFLASSAWYFSAVGSPTEYNDTQRLGNGFIELANTFGTVEDLTAIATYQGKLAVMSRRTTQIWSVDPDAANYQKLQTLPNIGTMAKLSVASVGDMDVYMLADNGIRSIRVRDASNNAIIADIGSPIDEIIQGLLETLTDAQKASACGVIEPSSNRYWLYLPGGHIYVFSYFPSSGIAAWSRYAAKWDEGGTALSATLVGSTATYTATIGEIYYWDAKNGDSSLTCGTTVLTEAGYFTASVALVTVQRLAGPGLSYGTIKPKSFTAFTPERFVVMNGRVYCRAGDKLFLYGGLDNQTYDWCEPQWDIPYLNAKSPATRKVFHGLDAICEGTWQVSLGTNVADDDDVALVYSNAGSSVMRGKSLTGKQGTHFKLRGVEQSGDYARFSSAILHYEGGDNK